MNVRLIFGLVALAVSSAGDAQVVDKRAVVECAFLVTYSTKYVGVHMAAAPKAGMAPPVGVWLQSSASKGGYELLVEERRDQLTVKHSPIPVAVADSNKNVLTFLSGNAGGDGAHLSRTYTFWDVNSDQPKVVMRQVVTPPRDAWGKDVAVLTTPAPLSPDLDRKVTSELMPLTVYDSVGSCGVGSIEAAADRYAAQLARSSGAQSK